MGKNDFINPKINLNKINLDNASGLTAADELITTLISKGFINQTNPLSSMKDIFGSDEKHTLIKQNGILIEVQVFHDGKAYTCSYDTTTNTVNKLQQLQLSGEQINTASETDLSSLVKFGARQDDPVNSLKSIFGNNAEITSNTVKYVQNGVAYVATYNPNATGITPAVTIATMSLSQLADVNGQINGLPASCYKDVQYSINNGKVVISNFKIDQQGLTTYMSGLQRNQSTLTAYDKQTNVDSNLASFVVENLAKEMTVTDKKINLDADNNGAVSQEELNNFLAKVTAAKTTLQNAKIWKTDSTATAEGYGRIDWNRDGNKSNDIGTGATATAYNNYLTVHGDLDQFIAKGMPATGQTFADYNVADMVKVVNSAITNNTNNSTVHVSGQSVTITYSAYTKSQTVDKLSDTQYGINITDHDMSKAAGVNAYNYAIYDTAKDAYIIGYKDTETGAFTIQGIVENVSRKIASPLTFDLNGDNKVDTTGISKDYDINGDGIVDKSAWAGVGDGVLAFDADNDKVAGEDGKELLGNNTDVDGDNKADGFNNGFQALKALAVKYLGLDSVSDNKLDANEIKLLEEKAGLTMLVDEINENGEVVQVKKSLVGDLGISEISLAYKESDAVDEQGNEHRQEGDGFTINGNKRKVDDVWYGYENTDSTFNTEG